MHTDMIITWLGESCFKIQAKGDGGTAVTLVIDPFEPKKAGRALPRHLAADLVLLTEATPLHNHRAGVAGSPVVISGPGEYETRGVLIYGMRMPGATERTIYYGNVEGISFVHCGTLNAPLTDALLEAIADVHIAMVPVGGAGVLSASDAADVVGQIEPRIVLPMQYADVQPFLKVMATSANEAIPELKITKKDLPEDAVRVVVLAPAT